MDVLDQCVGCNGCENEMAVREAFDRASKAWPEHGWIAYRCAVCEAWNHLAVADGIVLEGCLDGVPGPRFVQTRRVDAGDLRVTIRAEGIELRALNLRWLIPAGA